MLQNIRDKMQGHRWLTYLMLGALVLVFAAWGAYGIVDMSFGTTGFAAKVNGEKISTAEVNQLWQQQQPQVMQALGGNITDAQREKFQQELLDDQVRRLAVTQYANKAGFRVSTNQLGEAFRNESSFQVDGKFNVEAARSRLAAAGMSEAAYVKDLKLSLLVNQLLGSVGVSDFFTPAELKRVLALLDEERELRYLLLQPEAFAGTAPVDAAAIDAWYKAHTEEFMQPESVQLAYAELSLADVAVQVSEEQLRERYARDKATFVQPETRRASHILIAVEGATDDAKAAALAKDLHARIKAGGDFAALAKQYSKDSVSAAKGGDLEWASSDVYAKEFSDKLFAMKAGEISEPVKTQFGYHIIRLDGVRAESGRKFEEVRAELAATLRNEMAVAEFGNRQDQLQARLDRAGTTLEKLAQEFGMRRGEVQQFERGAGGLPLGSDAELNQAVFSDAVLAQGHVGGPVQLGEDRITIFQVVKHRPAQLRPLEEVRATIVTALRRERGMKAALAAAEAAQAKLAAGESFDKVAASLQTKAGPARFVGRGSPDLPVEIRDAVFAAVRPVAGKPFRQVIEVEGGGVALLEVTGSRVQSMSDTPQLERLRATRELQRYSRRNADGYVADVLKAARIRKNPQAFQ
ncbi:MAG: peptidyl-prolyl cis-trans isomerase [Steroidobacteraceae bacterium]